ncbi:MAG TPA: hypothetical protein VIM58_03620 [Candidatus Methylacidiphilales bacterium]
MKPVPHRGEPSWTVSSDRVAARVTRRGGHLGPVRFRLPQGEIEPYSVAPWVGEKLPAGTPPLLRALRGDFFCAPFGGNGEAWRGEVHPPHGETANRAWRFDDLDEEGDRTALRLFLRSRVRPGRVTKEIALRRGETVLYCRHVLSGFSGPMCPGHHAMLRFPEAPGSGLVTTSPILHAQVLPVPFEDPARGGYSALRPGAAFTRLDRVPRADGGMADLGRYPARRGFEDLAMVVHEAAPDFAWTAVVFPKERYVWFALKDPRVLRSTVLWMSNGGRHYAPWNGRHTGVLGLEDVTAYFHLGLAASARPNPVNRLGHPTALRLDPERSLVVNYVMGVAAIPAGFDGVQAIDRDAKGIVLLSRSGRRARAALDPGFIHSTPSAP